MPYSCALADCTNTKKTKILRGSQLMFHQFPTKRPDLCKIWVTKCQRKTKVNILTARICSDHFDDGCYESDMRYELLGFKRKRRLLPEAVPNVFPGRNLIGFKTRSRKQSFITLLSPGRSDDVPLVTPTMVTIRREDEEFDNNCRILDPLDPLQDQNENESAPIPPKIEHGNCCNCSHCQLSMNMKFKDFEEIEEFDPRSFEPPNDIDVVGIALAHESDEIEIKHDPFDGLEFEGQRTNVSVTNDISSLDNKSNVKNKIDKTTATTDKAKKEKPSMPYYPCKYCSRRFYYTSDRAKHYRTHTRDKRFKCNVCDKSFTQKCNLKRHVRLHTKEKPFCCAICQKTFGDSSALTRHLKVHSSKKYNKWQ